MNLADALVTRVLRLKTPARPYAVDRALRIPMRDGTTLAADHYTPRGEADHDTPRGQANHYTPRGQADHYTPRGEADHYTPRGEPAGTVLVRGPYGRGFPYDLLYARVFAARGYHVLFVSSRGTAGSGGEFDPMRTEQQDGLDVVAWLTAQPWFTGTFATAGPSYLGYTQWTLLSDPPPEMTAAVITVGPHDFSRHSWGSGAFNLDLVGWSDMIVRQGNGGLATFLRRHPGLTRARNRVFADLPLADAGERHFAGRVPWFRPRVTKRDLTDPYWAPMQHGGALDRAAIPILLHTGWQDMFLRQTFEQYARLRERGTEVALTVGPWSHVDTIGRGGSVLIPEALAWISGGMASRRTPVRIFVTGAGEWRDLPEWPPVTVEHRWDVPDGSFTFDPADPTPTLGGPLLDEGGYVDDTVLAARPDVHTVDGPVLTEPLEVIGTPVVELTHTSDTGFADLFVRLSELSADGRSRNVTETYQRLPAGTDPQPVRLELLPTAHRFATGSRLRLIVAGGSVPQFARNLGTDGHPSLTVTQLSTHHTLTALTVTLPTTG